MNLTNFCSFPFDWGVVGRRSTSCAERWSRRFVPGFSSPECKPDPASRHDPGPSYHLLTSNYYSIIIQINWYSNVKQLKNFKIRHCEFWNVSTLSEIIQLELNGAASTIRSQSIFKMVAMTTKSATIINTRPNCFYRPPGKQHHRGLISEINNI